MYIIPSQLISLSCLKMKESSFAGKSLFIDNKNCLFTENDLVVTDLENVYM